MFRPLIVIPLIFFVTACLHHAAEERTSAARKTATAVRDTTMVGTPIGTTPAAQPVTHFADSLKPYQSLEFQGVQVLKAAPGTKSVLFNSDGSRLYAMNLEGMSIYEFQQATRKVIREFRFKKTKGTGWDYDTDLPIPSYEEKPVEACLSHGDSLLWVSLHNAGGIVPIPLISPTPHAAAAADQVQKRVYITDPATGTRDSIEVPLIHTGKTPKIISRTRDSRHILVSNWHSYTVSVLETDPAVYPYAKLISTVPVSAIPRGIVVDDERKRSYVAIMGGASITVINNDTWKKDTDIAVASNPRHIVMDTSGHIFVSYNKLGKIACLDAVTGKTLFTGKTAAQPRTIILSKNHRFLFVTCYSSDSVQLFRVDNDRFTRIASLSCKGHPVGVDIFEDDSKLEAWVCSYTTGSINLFTFNKGNK